MNFFTKNPNLNYLFGGCGLGVWGEVWGGGGWVDGRTGPYQFAPSTSSKLGAQQ